MVIMCFTFIIAPSAKMVFVDQSVITQGSTEQILQRTKNYA